MHSFDHLSPEETRNLYIKLADDMAAAVMSQSSQSYDQLMESRKEIRELAESCMKQSNARKEILEDLKKKFIELDSH